MDEKTKTQRHLGAYPKSQSCYSELTQSEPRGRASHHCPGPNRSLVLECAMLLQTPWPLLTLAPPGKLPQVLLILQSLAHKPLSLQSLFHLPRKSCFSLSEFTTENFLLWLFEDFPSPSGPEPPFGQRLFCVSLQCLAQCLAQSGRSLNVW